jgi:hypothetical protein
MIMALSILAGAQLGGCADVRRATFLPPVNPESPVAGAVAAAATQNFKRPSFASVPPKPLNVAPAASVKLAVIDMARCRRAYELWIAAHPAGVSGTAGFAEDLRARLDNNPADRPTPQDEAAAEANAAALRAYAEPPPPMHPGPPPSAADAAAPGAKIAAAPARQAHPATAPKPLAAAPKVATAPPATPAPAVQTVAIVQPKMTPLYNDPVLAHCQ